MKKKIKNSLMLLTCLVTMGCSNSESKTNNSSSEELKLVPDIKFYYSQDNGATYGNQRRELEVGKNAYMKIMISIASNISTDQLVTVDITIPNVEGIDAYYNRGQKIPSKKDKLNNTMVYTPTLDAMINPEYQELVFQFIPMSEGSVHIDVTYDDSIPERYDYFETIEFVEKMEETKDDEINSVIFQY